MRLGPWEIALIALFVIMLFGARKIPELMRSIGLGIRELKKGLHEGEDKAKPPTGAEGQDEEKEQTKKKSTEI